MSNTVSAQHPAVVLRSSYLHLRALLAIAAIAIVGLTVAVVVLAINSGISTTVSPAARATSSAVRANPPVTVGANPDQRRLSPTILLNHPLAPQPGPISNYAGHY